MATSGRHEGWQGAGCLPLLRHGASLDGERLPASLDVPIIRQAVEALMAVSQEEREYWRLQDRIIGQRDLNNFREEARRAQERARLAEEAVGRLQEEARLTQERLQEEARLAQELAREKGEWIGRIHYSQELLQQTATPVEELIQFPLDELKLRAEELKQAVRAGSGS
jgi:hypothetical protein